MSANLMKNKHYIYIYIYIYIQNLKSQKQDVFEWILNKKTFSILTNILLNICIYIYIHIYILMQCCLELLRQHYLRFWPVECCPKSIETILHRISSGFFLLSGASRTTQHRVFTCAMLFGTSWTTLHKFLICAILSQVSLGRTLHRKNLM